MTRVEDQLKRLAAAPSLRPPLPMDDLTRRSSRIVRRRRIALSGLVVLVGVAIFVVPLPQLHLVHHPATHPTKSPKVPKKPDTLSKSIQPTPALLGPATSSLAGVSCTSATACAAVGYYDNSAGTALTLAAAWNGTTWTVVPTPNPTGTTGSTLAGVSCTSATACTAVGNNNGYEAGQPQSVAAQTLTLAEAWNGKKWSIVPTPNPTGTNDSYLSGVSCTSATACTAVGYYRKSAGAQVTLAETWNGAKWSIVPTPNPSGRASSSLSGVSCTSATACVAVGDYGVEAYLKDRTWAEAWNGKKWSIEPTPIPSATVSSSLSAVSCSAATACTAVGSYVTKLEDGPGTTLAESWNGKRWAIEPTPNPTGKPKYGALSGVSCTSATACTAVGEPRPDYRLDPMTLAESWNGTRWAIEPTPNADAGYYNTLAGVSCTSASACTAVGSYGLDRTLGEAWNGKRWSIETTPNGTAALVSQLTAVSCTRHGVHRRRELRHRHHPDAGGGLERQGVGDRADAQPHRGNGKLPVGGVVHLGHGVHRRGKRRRAVGGGLERDHVDDRDPREPAWLTRRYVLRVGHGLHRRRGLPQQRQNHPAHPQREMGRGQLSGRRVVHLGLHRRREQRQGQ
jgi:hypothetical protein